MGAGLARQSRERYPKCASAYRRHCRAAYGVGNFGEPITFDPCDFHNDANPGDCHQAFLVTKTHPHERSQLRLIADGLAALTIWGLDMNRIEGPEFVTHIYVPLLGCGLGGLPREQVQLLLDKYLAEPYYHLVVTEREATGRDRALARERKPH